MKLFVKKGWLIDCEGSVGRSANKRAIASSTGNRNAMIGRNDFAQHSNSCLRRIDGWPYFVVANKSVIFVPAVSPEPKPQQIGALR